MTTFPARAVSYANRVLSGEIVACKWVKAAARGMLDDLERSKTEWPYYFDEEAATRICVFIELLPHIEGNWASSHIVLEDWQVFFLCNLFGWLQKETGLRRFLRWYLQVARKNGKSPIATGICLYLTFCDGEPGAQVYSFATKKEQAEIIWNLAREMIRREPDFASLGAAYNAKSIHCVTSASIFRPLAKNFKSLDGLNTHGFVGDEMHAQEERGLYDVLNSSTGARRQSLGGGITTAGVDTASVCYELFDYSCRILNSVLHRHDGLGYPIKGNAVDDDRWFGLIYCLDVDFDDEKDKDDWADESVWIKANPNLNVSVQIDDLRAHVKRALATPSAVNEMLTKRFNVWVTAASAWLDMRAWNACANPALRQEDFADEECIAALDLASTTDIAAKVKVFRRNARYIVFSKFWLPEAAIEKSKNSQYPGWVAKKHLTVCSGNRTDQNMIIDSMRDDCKMHSVLELPYDPWQAQHLANIMNDEGAPMVEFRPNVGTMSLPMKEVEALVLCKQIEHDGNPVMTWMMGNIVCHRDAKDNVYPRKGKDESAKIDGGVALIMAIGRWMVRETEVEPGFAGL